MATPSCARYVVLIRCVCGSKTCGIPTWSFCSDETGTPHFFSTIKSVQVAQDYVRQDPAAETMIAEMGVA